MVDPADAMAEQAGEVAAFLSGLASPHRLLILCALAQGEQSVTDLIARTGIAQTSMSQHLAKLRDEKIVDFRREHRVLKYAIAHPAVMEIMAVLYVHFCGKDRS